MRAERRFCRARNYIPLDLLGFPIAPQAGDSDFWLAAMTNTVGKAPDLSMEPLAKAVQILKDMPHEEEWIDHARVGKDYWKMLEKNCSRAKEPPVYGGGGMLGILGGTRIILDEDLPPDVCEFRNKEGKVLRRLRLET